MSSENKFEKYARECARLADHAETPELREQLLSMAREWMRALMQEQDSELAPGE
jgi:hypothetical protein